MRCNRRKEEWRCSELLVSSCVYNTEFKTSQLEQMNLNHMSTTMEDIYVKTLEKTSKNASNMGDEYRIGPVILPHSAISSPLSAGPPGFLGTLEAIFNNTF